MRTKLLPLLVIGFSFVALHATPVQAQATRTWVSGVGDDANPCSRTAPCKTFAGAISKTAAGGEINTLDSGGFGAVTITKSISIVGIGVVAGVLAAGVNGIIINVAASDKVVLEGLDIEGAGTGLNGVHIIGGGGVTIRNCTIRNFTQNGINLVGTAHARAVVDGSMISGSAGGINVQGAGGVTNTVFLRNTVVDSNSSFSIQTAGTSRLFMTRSMLIGSPSAIITSGSGAVISYGDNVLRNAGVPTQTVLLQ
jgi:hypothetical protein